jgi:hypothetical protein
VVALVGSPAGEPLAAGNGENHFGLAGADGAGDVAPQRQALQCHAVVVVAELLDLDRYLSCVVTLLLGVQRGCFGRWNGIDPASP